LIDRRRLLASGAAALAISGASTRAGSLTALSSGKGGPPPPPDVDLMSEHGVLKRVLLIYQEALRREDQGQAPPVAAIHGGAEIIHEFIESFHEALEEGYVFPRLRSAGKLVSTVDTLLVQHGRGRQLTQLILAGSSSGHMNSTAIREKVTKAMAAFSRMYQPHEAREDTVVFPAFRDLLSTDELNELASTIADLQARQFGTEAFGAIVDRVADIERSLGIYDLNQFTPPPVAP
ncbi:MAG TPA: hemerythrin domain-containing protein, partial [Acidimicrobiales bacterium]|nr:hemerythrin domain-containing protein [Acidimicrobiales bacterium]